MPDSNVRVVNGRVAQSVSSHLFSIGYRTGDGSAFER